MELQLLIEDAGHAVAGWATDQAESLDLLARIEADLAFVVVHLADGPTGTKIAQSLLERDVKVVFMTANAKRVPEDFAGAIGIIAKPYTATGVTAALKYLHDGVRNPPPSAGSPAGLQLSPAFSALWATS